MTVVAGSGPRGIEDLAPPGSTIIRAHGALVTTAKVGDVWTVDGDVLGRVAAIEYDHGRRELLMGLVPELLYWHLKLRFELRLEGWGEIAAPLTAFPMPGHEWPEPGFAGLMRRLTGGRGNLVT